MDFNSGCLYVRFDSVPTTNLRFSSRRSHHWTLNLWWRPSGAHDVKRTRLAVCGVWYVSSTSAMVVSLGGWFQIGGVEVADILQVTNHWAWYKASPYTVTARDQFGSSSLTKINPNLSIYWGWYSRRSIYLSSLVGADPLIRWATFIWWILAVSLFLSNCSFYTNVTQLDE